MEKINRLFNCSMWHDYTHSTEGWMLHKFCLEGGIERESDRQKGRGSREKVRKKRYQKGDEGEEVAAGLSISLDVT